MKNLFVFLTLATLSFIGSSCNKSHIEPRSDFTGQYDVYRDEITSTVFKSTTTNGSTLLEVKKGVGDNQFILSYGLTDLYLSVTGNTFTITPQGVWIRESDGISYLGSILGKGRFSNNEITYQYLIHYNNKYYDENGFTVVRAKKR